MCTRFVFNGNDMITGFNFEIDLAVWRHTVITDPDRFFIGILSNNRVYRSYHGVNRNGNAGTLLYVHPNPNAAYSDRLDCRSVADLTERFIQNQISLADAAEIVQTKKITYAPDATMQAMLSDKGGNVLIIEPGIGWRQEKERFSLITNYSLLQPGSTQAYIVPGDDRYERTKALLSGFGDNFSVSDALGVLKAVRQEGEWATRVSFVYSQKARTVYYVLKNDFDTVLEHRFG